MRHRDICRCYQLSSRSCIFLQNQEIETNEANYLIFRILYSRKSPPPKRRENIDFYPQKIDKNGDFSYENIESKHNYKMQTALPSRAIQLKKSLIFCIKSRLFWFIFSNTVCFNVFFKKNIEKLEFANLLEHPVFWRRRDE